MEKINWDDFNEIKKAFDNTICRGEEKTLTKNQIIGINTCLLLIKHNAEYMKNSFEQARQNFAKKGS